MFGLKMPWTKLREKREREEKERMDWAISQFLAANPDVGRYNLKTGRVSANVESVHQHDQPEVQEYQELRGKSSLEIYRNPKFETGPTLRHSQLRQPVIATKPSRQTAQNRYEAPSYHKQAENAYPDAATMLALQSMNDDQPMFQADQVASTPYEAPAVSGGGGGFDGGGASGNFSTSSDSSPAPDTPSFDSN